MSAIVLRQQEQADLHTFAKAIVGSDLFTAQGIRTVEQAAVAMVAGREIGLGPIEAIRSFHFANGRVEPSADLFARLIRRHERYDYRVLTLDEQACELVFFDSGEEAGRSRFTMEDARQAELGGPTRDGKASAWQKFPRNMLFARAMTNGVAWFAPDVVDALRAQVAGVDDLLGEAVPEIHGESSPEPVAADVPASLPGPSVPAGVAGATDFQAAGAPTEPEPESVPTLESSEAREETGSGSEPSDPPDEAEALWNVLEMLAGSRLQARNALNRAVAGSFSDRTEHLATIEELREAIRSIQRDQVPA